MRPSTHALAVLSCLVLASAQDGTKNSKTSSSDECQFIHTKCPATQRFRSIDGSCNNLRYPWLGMANTPLLRLLDPAYGDEAGAPRRSRRGGPLPSAQRIVTRLLPEVDHGFFTTHLFVIWGQLVSHDVALIAAPRNRAEGPCCDKDAGDRCFSIDVTRHDPFYRQFDVTCLPLTRTNTSSCGNRHPEQLSVVTHYLDASFVYGSDANVTSRLRLGEDGLLRVRYVDDGSGHFGIFPPEAPNKGLCGRSPCYDVGDVRGNQNPMIAALQTLFLREHNRVAGILGDMNDHWDDERTFQEARRVVIAEWQLIVYRDWLKWLLGEQRVKELGLVPRGPTPRSEYFTDVDPRTANDVTTASYRALHSMVQGRFWLGSQGRRTETISRWFFNPEILEEKWGLLDTLKGLVYQQSQDQDRWMDNDITHKYEAEAGSSWGHNLPAVDIQRGRDHGLPGYTEYRKYVGLPEAHSFDDLLDTLNKEDVNDLRKIYEHVTDVDYYVGGLMERRKSGSLLFGPTFQPLLEDQFWRWRFADRFFYNFAGFAHSLRKEQIWALESTSVGRLLCDNVEGFEFVPDDAFIKEGYQGNDVVPCDSLRQVDFRCWKELKDGTYGC